MTTEAPFPPTRRDFLSLAGKGLGLATLSSTAVASLLQDVHAATRSIAHLSPQQVALDEDFWFTIQNAFSVTRGWLSDAVQVSSDFGDTSRWPGDTFGISTLSPGNVVLSWGSATGANGKKSDIFATNVEVQLH